MADEAPQQNGGTPVSTTEATNANMLNQVMGKLLDAGAADSTAVVTALTAIAAAITASIIGGTTGANDNRVLISKGTGGRALEASGVIADTSGNMTVAALTATTIVSPIASETVVGVTELATVAEVRSAATGNLSISAEKLETAAASVALTDASTIALDWDTGINFTVTVTATRTLGNPSNGQPGTWRTILVTQDGTGGWVLNYGNQYVFPSATQPILATGAGANNRIMIFCRTTSIYEVYGSGMGLA